MTKCIACGELLENCEVISISESGKILTYVRQGECPVCGKKYEWQDLYLYRGYLRPREIEG